jgi:ribonucleotide reductase alpha subunit
MQRVENGEMWSLFSPDEAPGLAEVYGEEFNKLYEKYEQEKRAFQVLPAREIFREIL